jgi:hypothetical protein
VKQEVKDLRSLQAKSEPNCCGAIRYFRIVTDTSSSVSGNAVLCTQLRAQSTTLLVINSTKQFADILASCEGRSSGFVRIPAQGKHIPCSEHL